MKLIHVILTPTHMQGTHQPTVHIWTGHLWREIVPTWIKQHEGYFVFGGARDSVYKVTSGWGCDGTTFLNGNGKKLLKEDAMRMIGVMPDEAVEVRI